LTSAPQRSAGFPITAALLAVLVHGLWGANPVAVKFGLEAFPPLWSAFIRFAIGSACIALWARSRGIRLWPEPGEWPSLWLISLIFLVQIFAMNTGYGMSPGSVGAVLTSTYPLFTGIFAHIFLTDDKLTRRKALGLVVAFGGAVLVLLHDGQAGGGAWLGIGGAVILFSAVLLGARATYTAHLLRRIDPVRIVLWQALLALPVFALGGYWFETVLWHSVSIASVSGLLYQGIVIAGFGFMVNTMMVRRYGPSLINAFDFVAPISGVALSLWLLSESLSWQIAAGTVTVGLGLYFIAWAPARR